MNDKKDLLCYICGVESYDDVDDEDLFLLSDSIGQLMCMNEIKANLSHAIASRLPNQYLMQVSNSNSSNIPLHRNLTSLVADINNKQLQIASEEIALESRGFILKGLRDKRRKLQNDNSMRRLINSHLLDANESIKAALPSLRWQTALRVLRMSKLELTFPGDMTNRPNMLNRLPYLHITGCSSIFGIPIPNGFSSENLLTYVPHGIISAALSHIAHVVDCLSAILNIPLQYELQPFAMHECAVVVPPFDK